MEHGLGGLLWVAAHVQMRWGQEAGWGGEGPALQGQERRARRGFGDGSFRAWGGGPSQLRQLGQCRVDLPHTRPGAES